MYRITWWEEREFSYTTSHRGTAISDYWTLINTPGISHVWLEDIENRLKYNPNTEEWEDMTNDCRTL